MGFHCHEMGFNGTWWDLVFGRLMEFEIPSGKLTVCYGKSQFLMGKSTISMAMLNSYVELPEGISNGIIYIWDVECHGM